MIFKFNILYKLSGLLILLQACTGMQPAVSTPAIRTDTIITETIHKPDRLTTVFNLPTWLGLTETTTVQNELLIIGISDPHLDQVTAFKQAVMRSKILATILSSAKISDCKEIYTNETEGKSNIENASKFTRFQMINSSLEYDESQFQLIDSATTFYGEKIVMMKFIPTISDAINNEKTEVDIHVMLSEYNLRSKFEENKFFQLSSKIIMPSVIDEATYRLYKVDEQAEIESSMNNEKFNFKTEYFKYLLNESYDVPEYPVKTKLYYGLWNALFESVVTQFSNIYTSSSFTASSLSDDYSNTNGSKNQTIDQQLHTIDFSGKMTRLFISENELTLQIEKTIP
jgi:hypothetical protein